MNEEELNDDELSNDELTPKQELFCHAYIKNSLNATRAYKEVYGEDLADESAGPLGCRLLKNVKISSRIKELRAEIAERMDVDAQFLVLKSLEIYELAKKGVAVTKFNPASGSLEKTGEVEVDARGANEALANVAKFLNIGNKSQIELEAKAEVKTSKLDDIKSQLFGDTQ